MTEYFEKAFTTLAKTDPFNTWLITDSANTAATIRKNLNTPLISDTITTLKNFAKQIVATTHPEIRIIDADEQLLLFAKLAEDSIFAKNGKKISTTLINQLLYIYSTRKTACIEIPDTTEKHQAIRKILDKYEKWSAENNICDSFSVMEKAIRTLDAGEFKIKNLIHLNVRPANKLAEKFFEKIQANAEEVLPYTIEPALETPPLLTEQDIVRHKDTRTEIETLLEKIAGLIENGVSPRQILVLSPALSKTARQIDEIIPGFYRTKDGLAQPLHYYAPEQGISLASVPIINSALACLSAITRDYKREDLEEILLSPFFPNIPVKITAGELRQISTITGVNRKKTEWLTTPQKLGKKETERFGSKIADITILLDWLSLEEHKNTLAEHSIAFKTLLKKTGWTDYPLPESADTARNHFLKILDTIQISATAREKTDLSLFYAYLLRFSLAKHAPGKETDDAFRIAKLTSAASMQADYVFIVGLTADNIPNIPATLPPFSEKETEEMIPGLKKQMIESEKYHFATALHSARKKLSLSCAKTDNGKNLIPSPFITRLFNTEPIEENIPLNHSILENQKKAGIRLRENTSCKGLIGLSPQTTIPARINTELRNDYCTGISENPHAAQTFTRYNETHPFAPTTLEDYVACPFHWYLTHHLHLYSPRKQNAEPIVIGLIIHKTLQRFFTEYTTAVQIEDKENAVAVLRNIAAEEFEKIKISTPAWTAKREWYLGENGLPSIFQKFVENEIKLTAEGWTTLPENTEKKIQTTISIDNKTLNIYGEIDRIVVNGNDFKIIDYKTGTSFEDKLKAGKLLQIPLYGKAFANDSGMNQSGGFYLEVTAKEFSVVDPFKGTTVSEKTDEILATCFESADNMRQGQINTAENCTNEYCELRYICRQAHGKEEA